MSPVAEIEGTLLDEPHHDGSELYVERPDAPGGEAVVRVRVPLDVDRVAVRWVEDGEARAARAEPDGDGWWVGRFPVNSTVTNYRWLLAGGEIGYAWLNGLGVVTHDVPDADDFVLSLDRGGPAWHLESVVYEIFPDRFASSGLDVEPPDWAVPRGWDELPTGRGPDTPYEWFGGDLRGAAAQWRDARDDRGALCLSRRGLVSGDRRRYADAVYLSGLGEPV